MTELAIIGRPVATVFDRPAGTKTDDAGRTVSAISDEALYGAVCRVLSEDGGFTRILSHYGYAGYVESGALIPVSEAEARAWLGSSLRMVDARCLDVLTLPSVHGECLASLPGGALIAVLSETCDDDGFIPVRLPDGREGFVTAVHLAEKRFGEDFLWLDPAPVLQALSHISQNARTAAGGSPGFSFPALLARHYGGSEARFRQALAAEAMKYLGTQYRWGGRSSFGIDCSGLVSSAYMRCGGCVYRDASISDGWPLRRIDVEWDADGRFGLQNLDGDTLRCGDALFFTGHVALYLGGGRYIHSTGRAGSNGVVINSLRPGEPDFREDLLKSLYAVGGLR